MIFMALIENFSDRQQNTPYVIAIGNFDGVHIAHQQIIKTCIQTAKEMSCKSAVLTFEPHPTQVLQINNTQFKRIYTKEQKIRKLSVLQVEDIFNITFDDIIARMSARQFVEFIIQHINVKCIITGYDFKFGYKRSGNTKILYELSTEYGYSYKVINKIMCQHFVASSTQIKQLLQMGAMGIAASLLGNYYYIEDVVVRGVQNAKNILGIPTANIMLKDVDIIQYPKYGVYLVTVIYNSSQYYGIANVGLKPTFYQDTNSTQSTVEIYIFNFQQNIYGENLRIYFLEFIRPERHFPTINDLKYQIALDIKIGSYIIKSVDLLNIKI